MSEQPDNQFRTNEMNTPTSSTQSSDTVGMVETVETVEMVETSGEHADMNKPGENNTTRTMYSVSLDDVKFTRDFRINKGALAQLVTSLKDMRDRLSYPDENNKVQVKLYPAIKLICNKLHDKYVDLLTGVDAGYHKEFSYFLMGPRGDGTLRYPTTNKSENKKYQYSELGPTFRAMANRLAHMNREIDLRLGYERYEDRKDSYVYLKKFLTDFEQELKECSDQWKTTVYSVRNEEGINKPAVLSDYTSKNNRPIGDNRKYGRSASSDRQNTQFVHFRNKTFGDNHRR